MYAPWSLRSYVRKAVRRHRKTNPAMVQHRYNLRTRLLHLVFDEAAYWRCLSVYILIAGFVVGGVVANDVYCGDQSCRLTLPSVMLRSQKAVELVRDLGGVFIGAQVGVLGVLSIAVSLVTLIAQRQNTKAEVRVYYAESLALPVTMSSLALLTVLCVQILWPAEFILHRAGVIEEVLTSQALLTAVHGVWLCLNLAGLAHFMAVSLSFGHSDERRRYRRQYTANVSAPAHLFQALLDTNYQNARTLMGFPQAGQGDPALFFGTSMLANKVEVKRFLRRRSELHDVRLWLLAIALRRWMRRAAQQSGPSPHGLLTNRGLLAFGTSFGWSRDGEAVLCLRQGGPPLTLLERQIIRLSFRFRRAS